MSGIGPKLQGLFANPDFGESLAQAQDFLNGNYGAGMDIAAKRFRQRGSAVERLARSKGSSVPVASGPAMDPADDTDSPPDAAPGQALDALANGTGNMAAAPSPAAPPFGAVMYGHRYLGGDPRQKGSWKPFGGFATGSDANIPADFGTWY